MKEKIKKFFIGMKDKGSRTTFVLSMAENTLSLVKLQAQKAGKWSALLTTEPLAKGSDEKTIAAALKKLLARMGYEGSRLVLALPRDQVTCRHVKMPSVHEDEIAKMVTLQSCQYLPYQAEDLVTGFQMLRVDDKGFTHTNLIILHKAMIERSIQIMQGAGIRDFVITLSSTGLSGLYGVLAGAKTGAVLAVGFNTRQVEVAVIAGQKTIFSRSFTADLKAAEGQELFCQEMQKTLVAYQKEAGIIPLEKIILLGEQQEFQEFSAKLERDTGLPVDILPYSSKIDIKHLATDQEVLVHAGVALSALIGLGLGPVPASLNLLPPQLKESRRHEAAHRHLLGTGLLVLGATLFFALGIAKDLDNKTKYLDQLKTQWEKISVDIKPLEYADKKFKAMQARTGKELTGAQALLEVYKVMPEQISLSGLGYEDGGRITLTGQAKGLEDVFTLVAELKKSSVFKDRGVEVRYATQRKTSHDQVADFEIVCGSLAERRPHVVQAQ